MKYCTNRGNCLLFERNTIDPLCGRRSSHLRGMSHRKPGWLSLFRQLFRITSVRKSNGTG